MFGRKARQIANQAVMIATARKESHDHLSQIMDKNKKIIELGKALQEAERQLEVERNELRQADQKVHRAESAADAAIQAAGIISDQLHAKQDQLALKTATIAKLNFDIEDLKADKAKLAAALKRALAAVNAIADADERKPGKPGTAQSRLPRLEVHPDVARLLDEAIDAKTDTPALQKLREEIAKVREGDVEVVYELAPLPKRTPGRKLQEQAAQDAAEVAKETTP